MADSLSVSLLSPSSVLRDGGGREIDGARVLPIMVFSIKMDDEMIPLFLDEDGEITKDFNDLVIGVTTHLKEVRWPSVIFQ